MGNSQEKFSVALDVDLQAVVRVPVTAGSVAEAVHTAKETVLRVIDARPGPIDCGRAGAITEVSAGRA